MIQEHVHRTEIESVCQIQKITNDVSCQTAWDCHTIKWFAHHELD